MHNYSPLSEPRYYRPDRHLLSQSANPYAPDPEKPPSSSPPYPTLQAVTAPIDHLAVNLKWIHDTFDRTAVNTKNSDKSTSMSICNHLAESTDLLVASRSIRKRGLPPVRDAPVHAAPADNAAADNAEPDNAAGLARVAPAADPAETDPVSIQRLFPAPRVRVALIPLRTWALTPHSCAPVLARQPARSLSLGAHS